MKSFSNFQKHRQVFSLLYVRNGVMHFKFLDGRCFGYDRYDKIQV